MPAAVPAVSLLAHPPARPRLLPGPRRADRDPPGPGGLPGRRPAGAADPDAPRARPPPEVHAPMPSPMNAKERSMPLSHRLAGAVLLAVAAPAAVTAADLRPRTPLAK